MENPFFHRLGRFLWGGVVILLVLLAIYVSVGRLLVTNVASWHSEILQALNDRGPFVVEADHMRGEWRSFTPILVLSGLHLKIPGSSGPPLELSEGRLAVDVLDSLRTGTLQLRHVVLEDLTLRAELTGDGSLQMQGLGREGAAQDGLVRDFLLNVETITLHHNKLVLTLPGGEVRSLGLDLTLSRDGSHRRADARLTSTRGADITVLAEGVGDPFEPDLFSGRVYADLKSTDLGAVKDLFSDTSLQVWAEGAVNLELWLDWERGTGVMQGRLEGRNMQVAPREAQWQLPLDYVSLQAQLQRGDGQWQFHLADIDVESGASSMTVPRVQLDINDDVLRVRAAEVDLQSLRNLLDEATVEFPAGLEEALDGLNPRGRVTALELNFDDLANPADNWNLAINFEGLAVDPMKGAPGASGVTAYASMAPGGGTFLIDSRNISLDFPKVYTVPLQFEDVLGTLDLHWDGNQIRLDSGLIRTQGEEGSASVLFGLDIPRPPAEAGIQLDLMVGLQNAHPTHRTKYLPKVINPALSNWLAQSIGDGMIERGAFVLRGSLKKGAAAQRTIQMAFNVSDTHLSYHSQWPPVLVRDGVVLIDDAEVSVWADSAELFASTVESLSVETWVNDRKKVALAVQGKVSGPAADGLKVLNESPLADIAGKAFSDWQLEGRLDTKLNMEMALGDSSVAPRVNVATRWHDVDILISPGNLPLTSVNGEFDYSTTHGLSSRALKGVLWGKTVDASLVQHHAPETGAYDPASTVLDVELLTEVEMADVANWLQLEMLAFASGRSGAEVGIRLAPGNVPRLSASSDLHGVSLDLPDPWRKPGDTKRQLKLDMPLGSGNKPLTLFLGDELSLRLDIGDNSVAGGALGVNVAPPESGDGYLRVSGRASLVQADEWMDFSARYFTSASPSRVSGGESGDSLDEDPLEDAGEAVMTASAPAIRVEALQADTLVILGRSFEDVRLGLGVEPSILNLALETEWLRAGLSIPRQAGTHVLDVDYLDLDRLPGVNEAEGPENLTDGVAAGEAGEFGEDLPPINVTLGNLYQSERRLGDLSFELSSADGVLTAQRISGELAHVRLRPEYAARLVWHRGKEERTQLQAMARFEDLGEVLEYLGYERILETNSGSLELDLDWPGAPHQFALAAGQGSVMVDIGSGSFLEAPSTAQGALRVVSILNLADIVRRLSLSQMFESGIPFDSVQGEIYLHRGTLEVARMDVAGGSSFQFSGVSNIETQNLNGELVATLPVANNLPWIAALAASLPVAAGVFVVSQVFNKQVKRLSSAIYSIDGTWDDPQVNFDRIFDNTSKSGGKGSGLGAAGLGAGVPGNVDLIPESPEVSADDPADTP